MMHGPSSFFFWNGSLYILLRLELVSWHFYCLDVPGSVCEVSCVLFCCFGTRAPGSLAGGFLVAVVGRALLVVCVWVLFLRDFYRGGPIRMFNLFTCTMGSAPIKWTCTVVYSRREQDSLLTGPYWPQGSRRKKDPLGAR